ncbi:MAG: hypothetical protein ABII89_03045 [Candidatus Omnitrophota bacterium]
MRAEEELAARARKLAEGCIQITKDLREIRLALCPDPEGCPPSENDPLVQMCDRKWDEYRRNGA